MARITINDCLLQENNRFNLILKASHRARKLIMNNAKPFVEWQNDKATVVALREIAAGYTNFEETSE